MIKASRIWTVALAWLMGCSASSQVAVEGGGSAAAAPGPTLSRSQAGWEIRDLGSAAEIAEGSWFIVQDTRELPISLARPVVAVARALARPTPSPDEDPLPPTRLPVEVIFTHPDHPLDGSTPHPVTLLTETDDVRVGSWFGRVIGTTDEELSVLNIGALDGAFVGARYHYVEPQPGGELRKVGACVVPLEGLFGGHAHCRVQPGADGAPGAPVANGFVLLEPPPADDPRLTSPQCGVKVGDAGALSTLGESALCGLLQSADRTFTQEFGLRGEGGVRGIYLTPMYTDAALDAQARQTGGPRTARVDQRFRDFLKDSDQKVLLVLGGMGVGKTTFALKALHEQARSTLQAGEGRVPLMVSLTDDLRAGETLDQVSGPQLIARAIARSTGRSVPAEQITRDLEEGHLLVVFDGLDEVGARWTITQVVEGYKKLSRSAGVGKAKVIITCRASTDPASPLAVLNNALMRAVDTLLFQSWIHLVRFDTTMVESYMERLVPDPAQRQVAMARLQASWDLETLAHTPALVYLVGHYLGRAPLAEAPPPDMFSLLDEYAAWFSQSELAPRGVSEAEQRAFLARADALGLATVTSRRAELPEVDLRAFIEANPWLEASAAPTLGWREGLQEARGGALFSYQPEGEVYRFVDPSIANFLAARALLPLARRAQEQDSAEERALFLERLRAASLPPQALAMLAEGLGRERGADQLLARLLSQAQSGEEMEALFRLRLLRQELSGALAQEAVRPVTVAARQNSLELYKEEATLLEALSREQATSFLASPAGERYAWDKQRPGVLRDKEDDSLWVFVPGVSWIRGGLEEDVGNITGGSALGRMAAGEPFLIGLHELTNEEFKPFVMDGYSAHAPVIGEKEADFLDLWVRKKGRKDQVEWIFPRDQEHYPVTHLSWLDIQDYLTWRSKKDGIPVRIPNEVEWELAARGLLGRRYPWGDAYDPSRAPTGSRLKFAPAQTVPEGSPVAVDAFPPGASPFGALFMAGNVWEWVLPGESISFEGQRPALRGGSCRDDPSLLLLWMRRSDGLRPQTRAGDVGLRLRRPVLTPDQAPPPEAPPAAAAPSAG